MTQHKSVSIFGSHMSAVNFVNQLAKAVSAVNNAEALYSGNLESMQIDGLVSGLLKLASADIRFKRRAAVELDGFKALAKAATNDQGESLMVIDNVQSLYRYGRSVPFEVAWGEVKSVARDSQVPIIGILKRDDSLPLPYVRSKRCRDWLIR